jgi:nucleotide-binding universal stress UspA family protein
MAVVDETPECERAMRYAGMRAKNSNGGLVLVYVIQPGDFQHWLGVEEIMRAEAMEEAEATVAKAAEKMRQIIGIDPETHIRQGQTTEEIHSVIEEDQDIAILVLAAGSAKDGPGPLVSSIAGRGAAFPIPVTVIPDALSDEEIDALT